MELDGVSGGEESADPRFARVRTLFFGLGAQKAGTTWLHRYIRSHPDLATPALKETTYWNYVETGRAHDWTRRRAARFGAGSGPLPTVLRRVGSPFPSLPPEEMVLQAKMLDDPPAGHRRYADLLFHGWRGEPAIGEITPTYALLSAETLRAMAALSGRARFFFVMRDPVARALSGLRMALARGWFETRGRLTLDAAIDAAVGAPEESFAIACSRYDRTIARLESSVPQADIHLLFYETLFDQLEIDRLTEFLGVSGHAAPTERRILAGGRSWAPPSAERVVALRKALEPAYAFAADRFGASVPVSWRL